MLVLNDPAAQLSSVDALNSNGAATAAPMADLSAFASSNDVVVKVLLVAFWFCCSSCCRLCWKL